MSDRTNTSEDLKDELIRLKNEEIKALKTYIKELERTK